MSFQSVLDNDIQHSTRSAAFGIAPIEFD